MAPVLALFDLGTGEIVMIVIAGLVLFGSTKLPKFARSLGQSVNEFKQGMKDPPKPFEPKEGEKAPVSE
jgi:sec-independent protein translocase protein TatA